MNLSYILKRCAGMAPRQWFDFLEERYEGGKKQVPNTNSKGKKTVSVNYLIKKDPNFKNKLIKEFKSWLGTKNQKELFTEDLEEGIEDADLKKKRKLPKIGINQLKKALTTLYGADVLNVPDGDNSYFSSKDFSSQDRSELWDAFSSELEEYYNEEYESYYAQYLDEEMPNKADFEEEGEEEEDEPYFDEAEYEYEVRKAERNAEYRAERAARESRDDYFEQLINKRKKEIPSKAFKDLDLRSSTVMALMGFSSFYDDSKNYELEVSSGKTDAGETYYEFSCVNAKYMDEYTRSLFRDKEGNLHLYNTALNIDSKAPKGLGTKLFASQVFFAKHLGVKSLTCSAYRDLSRPNWIGYKIWPKMGYDGQIPENIVKKLPKDILDKFDKLEIKEPYKVSHLYSLPDDEGIKWWEEHGGTFDAEFDLSDNSYSMQTLHKYLGKKASENKKKASILKSDPLLKVFFLKYAESLDKDDSEKKKGLPPRWLEFLKEKYNGGKKRVPNTNPKTKKQFKEVAMSTLFKNDSVYREKINKEYQEWLRKSKQTDLFYDKKDKPKKEEKPFNPKPSFLDAKLESTIKHFEWKYKKVFDQVKISKDVIEKGGLGLNIHLEGKTLPPQKVFDILEESLGEEYAESYTSFMESWQKSSFYTETLKMAPIFSSLGVAGDLTESDKEKLDKIPSDEKAQYTKIYKEIATTVYALQQAFFRNKGIKTITLYRGVKGKSDPAFAEAQHGAKAKIKTRSISSFTGNPGITSSFVDETLARPCYVRFDVPVERIWNSPLIENGLSLDGDESNSYFEEEYIVIGASELEGTKVGISKTKKRSLEEESENVEEEEEKNQNYSKNSFNLYEYKIKDTP